MSCSAALHPLSHVCDACSRIARINSEAFEHSSRTAVGAAETDQYVFGADVAVASSFGLILGERQSLLGVFGESLKRVHVVDYRRLRT